MAGIVFAGPTLPHAIISQQLPDAIVQPPVAAGDILRCLVHKPHYIAIIDGYFEERRSVWHKEILLALEQGIPVYGAASMGALRAAELASFGMQGVGQIYHAYASGECNDDDEVTVLHLDEAHGFKPVSDAMVNIRATLSAAGVALSLPETVCNTVTQAAKQCFYKERRLLPLLAQLAEDQDDPNYQALLNWVRDNGCVDQKALDAHALLRQLATADDHAAQPTITVNQTLYLQHFATSVFCQPAPSCADGNQQYAIRLAHLLAALAHCNEDMNPRTIVSRYSGIIPQNAPLQSLLMVLAEPLTPEPMSLEDYLQYVGETYPEKHQFYTLVANIFSKIYGMFTVTGLQCSETYQHQLLKSIYMTKTQQYPMTYAAWRQHCGLNDEMAQLLASMYCCLRFVVEAHNPHLLSTTVNNHLQDWFDMAKMILQLAKVGQNSH
mgnify:CR=1 FL=1|tara:strand:+ start:3716 stop:5029 length:1314 start_codon:yes stop_codon:yes gene_type:complete